MICTWNVAVVVVPAAGPAHAAAAVASSAKTFDRTCRYI
jgi:hypothetical protein